MNENLICSVLGNSRINLENLVAKDVLSDSYLN